jgi:hypothetical protein
VVRLPNSSPFMVVSSPRWPVGAACCCMHARERKRPLRLRQVGLLVAATARDLPDGSIDWTLLLLLLLLLDTAVQALIHPLGVLALCPGSCQCTALRVCGPVRLCCQE